MTREKLVEEQRRLNRVQKAILSASKEPHGAEVDDLIEAVAQLSITVAELLKEHVE